MTDIGLLIAMLDEGIQANILNGSLYGYKGAIYENLMADFLVKAGRKLYYYHKDSGLEIDFLIKYDGECVLVECKANTGNAKSVKTVLKHPEKYHVYRAFKFGDYNVGEMDSILTLPFYMGFIIANKKKFWALRANRGRTMFALLSHAEWGLQGKVCAKTTDLRIIIY